MTKADGKGPVLLILPLPGTSFEAWRPLVEDISERGLGFEGHHEVLFHSLAYANNEWKNVQPWVTPTFKNLKPGESAFYGFRLLLAPGPVQVRGMKANTISKNLV